MTTVVLGRMQIRSEAATRDFATTKHEVEGLASARMVPVDAGSYGNAIRWQRTDCEIATRSVAQPAGARLLAAISRCGNREARLVS
jgi:hypothetical protein